LQEDRKQVERAGSSGSGKGGAVCHVEPVQESDPDIEMITTCDKMTLPEVQKSFLPGLSGLMLRKQGRWKKRRSLR